MSSTAEYMIKRYAIRKPTSFEVEIRGANPSNVIVENKTAAIKDNAVDAIKRMKSEIITILDKKEADEAAKREEREKKLEAIDGLQILRDCIYEHDKYREGIEEYFDTDGAVIYPKAPASFANAAAQYPRAAAYLTAEKWMMAANYKKSHLGEKAAEKILNGEDHETVIASMKSEWNDYCMAHMFD